jgi:hypothetical protein
VTLGVTAPHLKVEGNKNSNNSSGLADPTIPEKEEINFKNP